MDEILNRLAEIKAEAEALRASADEGRLERLRELKVEHDALLAQKEEQETLDALTAVAEEPVAEEVPAEEAPAEEVEVVEVPAEAPAEVVETVVEEETEAVKPEDAEVPAQPIAAAALPVDTDVPSSGGAASPVHLIASGNVGGTNPGDQLGLRDIDRIHRHASVSKPGNGSVSSVFASMNVGNGSEPLNERNSPERNSALMASATRGALNPLTAAAAFCGPDDIVLDICAAGTTARPVLDLFRTVPVRGRFRYMKTATLLEVAPGIGDGTGGVWTEADQIALDTDTPATWKPCVDLSCRAETTVTPYAIPACTTIGVWQQLSAPEQVTNWLNQMHKQYSRVAETALLDRIRAQSYVYTAGVGGQGIWTTIQALLAHAMSDVGTVNRDTTEGYVIIAPYGFTAALAADEGMRGMSQNLAVQHIQRILLENFGMRIVESYETDSTVGPSYRTGPTDLSTKVLGGAGTAFVQSDASPDVYPIYVLSPDAFIAGQSDVVEAGYYRDGTLVRQNLVRYFWEGMEFLEKTCDNLSFVFELSNCPSGVAPALSTAPSCSAAL